MCCSAGVPPAVLQRLVIRKLPARRRRYEETAFFGLFDGRRHDAVGSSKRGTILLHQRIA